MIKILFVCHGNICRSPMAEFIFRDMVKKAGRTGQFHIDSAAVSREELGNPIYPPARRELQKHGIPCEGHAARQITKADGEAFDHIYYMDSSNAWYLAQMLPEYSHKISPLLDRDVADPWYTGNFSVTYRDILEGCKTILEDWT